MPYFECVREGEIAEPKSFPVIVKPTDRSGSRAITKVTDPADLPAAIEAAVGQSFEKKAIIEEYIFRCGVQCGGRSATREDTPALQSPRNLQQEVLIILRLDIYSRLLCQKR